ncbi:hypothetical protein ACWD4G_18195 [Streptomyces sp. NPDC002643]
MSGRETVLRAVCSALTEVPGDENSSHPEALRRVRRRSEHTGADLVALFVERAADYRTHGGPRSAADAAAGIGSALVRAGALAGRGWRTTGG